MIEVSFHQTGSKLSLRLKGHADYAEHGKDIVCASASILAYTVAQFVMAGEKQGDLVSPAEVELNSGDTKIICEPRKEVVDMMHSIYSFAKMGYWLLEHNYPQYIRVNDVEAETP